MSMGLAHGIVTVKAGGVFQPSSLFFRISVYSFTFLSADFTHARRLGTLTSSSSRPGHDQIQARAEEGP